jgi:S1-C subfamily serine protease
VSSKLSLVVTLCAVLAVPALPAAVAAGPPLPLPVVPDAAQDRVQAQLAIQQAQAQANLAASQARLQAQLNANQARLEGQVAAQQQAQLNAARQGIATPAPPTEFPLPIAVPTPMRPPFAGPIGTMQLATLTPRLGSYFGTPHGVLVIRAPAHGMLKLRDGDVILSIGGRVPASGTQAIRILTSYDPGEKIKLEVLRERHRIDITATMPGPPPSER